MAEFYKMIWQLSFYHKYSLNEIEDLMPYEREIYVGFILDYIEKREKENNSQ